MGFLNGDSGTDDDLPDHGLVHTSKGALVPGTMRISSGPVSRAMNLPDMELQIHCIETEAYAAVLRAFIAQSDVLSWEKEELMTELRQELRVSDQEHREILQKINSDDLIKSIKELRRSADVTMMNPPAHKRLKPAHGTVSSSPKFPPSVQPSPAAILSPATHARDDQWGTNANVFSPQMNAGQAMVPVPQNRQGLSTGKLRRSLVVKTSKQGFIHSGFEDIKPGSDIIEIRATDKLIQEIEKACCGLNPDPTLVERAKLILREHERALMEAIGKLADMADGDDFLEQEQHLYSSGERQKNAHGLIYNASCVQFDRSRSYYSEGYIHDQAERGGIPCMNLQGDEY